MKRSAYWEIGADLTAGPENGIARSIPCAKRKIKTRNPDESRNGGVRRSIVHHIIWPRVPPPPMGPLTKETHWSVPKVGTRTLTSPSNTAQARRSRRSEWRDLLC